MSKLETVDNEIHYLREFWHCMTIHTEVFGKKDEIWESSSRKIAGALYQRGDVEGALEVLENDSQVLNC